MHGFEGSGSSFICPFGFVIFLRHRLSNICHTHNTLNESAIADVRFEVVTARKIQSFGLLGSDAM
jgi:hypothetical protein